MAEIIIPTPLRKFTNNQESYETNKTTVGEALKELVNEYPELEENLMDDNGDVRNFVRIYVGEKDISALDDEATEVDDDATISIIPAIAGG
jgi:molybdopterin converting factor small subunit